VRELGEAWQRWIPWVPVVVAAMRRETRLNALR
jgi:hypothetical protein